MPRVKRLYANSPENLADHVRHRTETEMVAFVNGFNACMEVVMHEFNCYAGFHHYGPKVAADVTNAGPTARYSVGPDHPDYLEWRKLYYTIAK